VIVKIYPCWDIRIDRTKKRLLDKYQWDEHWRKFVDHPDVRKGSLDFCLEFWAAKVCGFKGTILDYGVMKAEK